VLTAKTPESNQAENSFQYNASNLVTQRTDARGVITTYTYDNLNRLTGTSYNVGSTGVPATPTVTLTYDEGGAAAFALGRLTTMTDGPGQERYTYDKLGRLTTLDKTINGTIYTTQYVYNDGSELTQINYPSSRVVQQSYDAVGRLCAVATSASSCSPTSYFASGFGYNTAQEVTGFNYGNGVAASFGYDPQRLLLQSLGYVKGATTLLSLSYGYTQNGGNNGQVTSITDNTGTQEAGRSVTYTYDSLYRLSTAVTTGSTSYPTWGLSWTYDRYGNRLNQTQTAGSPPTNSLSFANPGGAQTNRQDNMCFDANGNLLAESSAPCPVPTYVYDAENRLVNYSSAAYTYDGRGLRVKKVSGSATTVYIFSGSKVIAEYDNAAPVGSPSREYIYSGGTLLAKVESGAATYFHRDHLSNRVLTDSGGNSIGQRGHYPYGETWYETGTTTKLKFTSYERDDESTNDFAMARYHINRFGRFSSPDPFAGSIADPQSLNRFGYARNDPSNAVDPSGLNSTNGCDDVERIPCGQGGGGRYITCIVDGVDTPCDMAYRMLASGAAVECPNDVCSGIAFDAAGKAVYVQYYAFTGASGYFKPTDLANGINVVNGRILNDANYEQYVLEVYQARIESQKVAAANKLAELLGISPNDAYAMLVENHGFLKGGNYNFQINPQLYNSVVTLCGGQRCDNALHFTSYVHLDTAYPFGSLRGFFEHTFVDVFGGNIVFIVIPRH
jgi:RHS repeat-associated protein